MKCESVLLERIIQSGQLLFFSVFLNVYNIMRKLIFISAGFGIFYLMLKIEK